jgi:hypothetical protein
MAEWPELDQLQAFFGGSHRVVGSDVPDWYSPNRFELVAAKERLVFEVVPGEGEVAIIWYQNETVILNIQLQSVGSLEISRSGEEERLIGTVNVQGLSQMFKLQVRPRICFEWGTRSQ